MAQQAKPAADHSAVDEPITRAIMTAEARSAAEIAVAILPRADRYTLTSVLAALLLFAVLHAVLGWVDLNALLLPMAQGSGAWLDATAWLGMSLALGLSAALFVLCEWTVLGVRLTPQSWRQRACRARARVLFLEQGIDATEDRLGLLICVSEAERQIEILPDRGISAVIAAPRWQVLIEAFLHQKRAGTLDAALAQLVEAVASELAPHFPPRPGQVNELPDAPIRL
ncbi:MAG TPA: hypothetical protein VN229_12435 [Terriglobales bacterium]|nr:hypothetical protein [Terriglobales bacterium]